MGAERTEPFFLKETRGRLLNTTLNEIKLRKRNSPLKGFGHTALETQTSVITVPAPSSIARLQ